jgi:hypothetical protein
MHRRNPSAQATARAHLHDELGRLVALLANEQDPRERTDLADEAFDVLAVLERLDGAASIRHPRGLRLIRSDAA